MAKGFSGSNKVTFIDCDHTCLGMRIWAVHHIFTKIKMINQAKYCTLNQSAVAYFKEHFHVLFW